MRIAVTLGKSLKEIMELDVLEINLWYAWFSLEAKKNKEAMSGNANNRNPRRR